MEGGLYVSKGRLTPYMTRLGAWSFSIGTSIGWGSFIVTCNTYLSQAGILGTIFGLILGMAVILVINHNLCYMMERVPDAGGIYTYGKMVRGSDTGFLVAWLLLLTYMAVLWANITSLPLFARRFLGTMFEFGYCYTIFGYDVYIGEALLSIGALALIGLLCARSRKVPMNIMIALALVFVGATAAATLLAVMGHQLDGFSYDPLYIPRRNELAQIVRIAVISPWAFIGFENVAHFSEEFKFPVRKIKTVMLASVILTTAFYIMMTVLSATAYPSQYGSWLEYIRDMNNLSGIEAVPAFYAVNYYMGSTGVSLLLFSLLSVIITSIIGNLTAISRLIYAFARDHEWSGKLAKVNRFGIPGNAILAVVAFSCLIPFLGRTAISWIVDVTTLGATIIYGFLSDFVARDARDHGDRPEQITGRIGIMLMIGFGILLMVPKLLSYEAMEAESYLLFAGWSLLGLIVFRVVILKDKKSRYGHSIIVWIVLLLLMLMTIMMWENRETQTVTEESMKTIQQYYQEEIIERGGTGAGAGEVFAQETSRISGVNSRSTLVAYTLFMIAVSLMLSNYVTAKKHEHALLNELGEARKTGMRDSLTGVKNRSAYTEWEKEINEKIRSGTAEPFAVVVCDINDLKKVNDTYGHEEGDVCIQNVCSDICRIFTHSPVFRYGGDEFVVLLTGRDYVQRDQLMRLAYEHPKTTVDGRSDTFAAGMAEFDPATDETLMSVFDKADTDMYDNKRALKGAQK